MSVILCQCHAIHLKRWTDACSKRAATYVAACCKSYYRPGVAICAYVRGCRVKRGALTALLTITTPSLQSCISATMACSCACLPLWAYSLAALWHVQTATEMNVWYHGMTASVEHTCTDCRALTCTIAQTRQIPSPSWHFMGSNALLQEFGGRTLDQILVLHFAGYL